MSTAAPRQQSFPTLTPADRRHMLRSYRELRHVEAGSLLYADRIADDICEKNAKSEIITVTFLRWASTKDDAVAFVRLQDGRELHIWVALWFPSAVQAVGCWLRLQVGDFLRMNHARADVMTDGEASLYLVIADTAIRAESNVRPARLADLTGEIKVANAQRGVQ